MNRQQRRAQGKTVKKEILPVSIPPLIPLSIEGLMKKYPDITNAVEAYGKKCNTDGRNEVFNVLLGCMLITLHDKYAFDSHALNTITAQAIEQMECIHLGLVKEKDIIAAVDDIGVKVSGMDYDGQVKVGAQEVRERLKAYTEVVEDMSKMDNVFEMLNNGEHDISVIADKLGVKKKTVSQYKVIWTKRNLDKATPQDIADSIFADNEPQNEPQEEIAVASVEIVAKEKETLIAPIKAELHAEQQIEEKGEIVGMEEKRTLPIKGQAPRKLKVTRTVTMEGEFGTYEATNQVVSVKLESREMELTKENICDFIAELQEVASNM